MLASAEAIRQAIEAGEIVIEPFDERQLGANSYDCRLGEWYFEQQDVRYFNPFREESVFEFWGEPKQAKGGYIAVKPGQTILAHTVERIGANNLYVAKMYARSSIGRSCLSVCRCAGLGDIGYVARWTMEISNASSSLVFLQVGRRICQIAFYRATSGEERYHGKYGQQAEWTPCDMLPKLYQDWDA